MINKCFKGVFIGVNILLAIAGVLFIASASLLHFFLQAQDVDISLVEEVLLFLGGGTLVVNGLGIYGASKHKIWPLTAYITATLIGMIVFLMLGAQTVKLRPVILKYIEHYVKSEDARKKIVTGLDTGLGAIFGLAGLEVLVIILASVLIHQLQRHQAAMPDPTREGAKPPAYSELCQMTDTISIEQLSGDSPKLIESS
ncbi:hypothetical protein AALO_G00287660 [Alosa alosa]|uniref:Uncharacterized protein n=1 Tax=Alosa alosa TaxID=278164 RepID=A0AAV6FKX0_9TELE|nr:hypothetical protein AALO_G00287660 [Alosa alosa]